MDEVRGFCGKTGDPRSSQSVDDIIYGTKD